jgi:hypothetical protein
VYFYIELERRVKELESGYEKNAGERRKFLSLFNSDMRCNCFLLPLTSVSALLFEIKKYSWFFVLTFKKFKISNCVEDVLFNATRRMFHPFQTSFPYFKD